MSILMTETPHQETAPETRHGAPRAVLALASLAYGLLVGLITLSPEHISSMIRRLVETALEGGMLMLSPLAAFLQLLPASLPIPDVDFEVAANVLMFVPFGVLAALWSTRSGWFAIGVAGVAVSCAIEVTQFFLPGRVTDLSDVVANGAGATIGALIVVVARALVRRFGAADTAGAASAR